MPRIIGVVSDNREKYESFIHIHPDTALGRIIDDTDIQFKYVNKKEDLLFTYFYDFILMTHFYYSPLYRNDESNSNVGFINTLTKTVDTKTTNYHSIRAIHERLTIIVENIFHAEHPVSSAHDQLIRIIERIDQELQRPPLIPVFEELHEHITAQTFAQNFDREIMERLDDHSYTFDIADGILRMRDGSNILIGKAICHVEGTTQTTTLKMNYKTVLYLEPGAVDFSINTSVKEKGRLVNFNNLPTVIGKQKPVKNIPQKRKIIVRKKDKD